MGYYNSAINSLKGLGGKANRASRNAVIGTAGVTAGLVGTVPGVVLGGIVGSAFDKNNRNSDFGTLGATIGGTVGFLSAKRFASNGTRSFVNKFWK